MRSFGMLKCARGLYFLTGCPRVVGLFIFCVVDRLLQAEPMLSS
jgi:hypothetical protein